MWSLLQTLRMQSDLPWCVMGDFNEALWSFEHLSVTPRGEQLMLAYRDTLEVCGLMDLGFSGFHLPMITREKGGEMSRSDWTRWLQIMSGEIYSLMRQ